VSALRQPRLHCSRTPELVSLELDGELTQLELARLESHLQRCASCRALRAELVGLTSALRAAPLEQLERPISMPQRVRWSIRPLQIGAVAAAVAVAAGLAGLVGSVRSNAPAQPQYLPAKSGPADGLDALRSLRRAELIPRVPVGQAGGHQNV
jgi:anti-sigma factor RsiW